MLTPPPSGNLLSRASVSNSASICQFSQQPQTPTGSNMTPTASTSAPTMTPPSKTNLYSNTNAQFGQMPAYMQTPTSHSSFSYYDNHTIKNNTANYMPYYYNTPTTTPIVSTSTTPTFQGMNYIIHQSQQSTPSSTSSTMSSSSSTMSSSSSSSASHFLQIQPTPPSQQVTTTSNNFYANPIQINSANLIHSNRINANYSNEIVHTGHANTTLNSNNLYSNESNDKNNCSLVSNNNSNNNNGNARTINESSVIKVNCKCHLYSSSLSQVSRRVNFHFNKTTKTNRTASLLCDFFK
jgi:hypothetical protein